MNLIQRIFGSSKKGKQPDITFGRYTDAYKSKAQIEAYDQAMACFEEGNRLEAYRLFMRYLKDEDTHNLVWREENDTLFFEFQQGSRRIFGQASENGTKAESRVALVGDELNVGFLRRLMEVNFNLKFSRFALSPDNALTIVFDTHGVDGSPLKLFQALRELALHADKQDDILLDEFKMLKPAEERTFGDIPEREKTVKYEYIRKEVERMEAEFEKAKPDPNQFPGTYAYMLLAAAFKFDYFVQPEGFMMDVMERIHAIYFAKNDKTPHAKIAAIRKEYQKLLERSKEDFFKEMYRTRSTFGVNPPVGHNTIAALIDGELPNMEWPMNQNHMTLALAVPMYIAGFAMFHYTPPKPTRELFHLFYQVMEPAFFQDLGFNQQLVLPDGKLQKSAILGEITAIRDRNKADYARIKIHTDRLNFASDVLFAKTYMQMIREMELNKE